MATSTQARARSDGRDTNEELIKFLNEVRVMLPGVQVLFAFLLTVPFMDRFARATDLQRSVYFVALMSAAASTLLLIAPSVNHRLRWHEGASEKVMATGNRLVIAGTIFLAAAISAAVFLVTDMTYGGLVGDTLVAATAGGAAWLWWGLPLVQRARDGDG